MLNPKRARFRARWDLMDGNLLGTIFGFLRLGDRLKTVNLVCRDWLKCKSICDSVEISSCSSDKQLASALQFYVSKRVTTLSCIPRSSFMGCVSAVGLSSLHSLSRLQVLNLSHCVFDDNKMAQSLAYMNSLQNLDLSWTGLTDGGLQHLVNLPALAKLNLCHADISNSAFQHLVQFQSLRYLDISSTDLTDMEQLETLTSLTSLVEVNIEFTSMGVHVDRDFLRYVSTGSLKMVQSYLKKPWINVHATDHMHRSAVHIAAQEGHVELLRLLGRFADIDVNRLGDFHGRTALSCVAYEGNEEMAIILVHELGADVNKRDNFGDTPLCRAASQFNESMCRLLVEFRADINACNYKARSILNAFGLM